MRCPCPLVLMIWLLQAVPGPHRWSQLYRHIPRRDQAVDRRARQHRPLLGLKGGTTTPAARLYLTGRTDVGTCSDSCWRLLLMAAVVRRSFLWATVPLESGSLWAWRAATWRSCTTPNLTNISCTCMKAASSPSSLPTAVSSVTSELRSGADQLASAQMRKDLLLSLFSLICQNEFPRSGSPPAVSVAATTTASFK